MQKGIRWLVYFLLVTKHYLLDLKIFNMIYWLYLPVGLKRFFCKFQMVTVLIVVSEVLSAQPNHSNGKQNTINNECRDKLVINGFSLYFVKPISRKPILAYTLPAELDANGCFLDVVVARGEYEPASFVIRSEKDIDGGVSIISSSLTNERGGVFPKKNIEIKVVKVWYQAAEAWSEIARVKSAKDNSVKLVPELLLNDESLIRLDEEAKENYIRVSTDKGDKYLWKGSKEKHRKSIINLSPGYYLSDSDSLQAVSIKKNENKQIWVTFYVPVDTQSGVYKGYLRMLNNDRLTDIPVKLTVLPYKLPEPRLEYGMYYHGRLHVSGKESISSEYKSVEQLRAELIDMYQHGIKNPIIYQHHYKNEKKFKEYMSIRKELGLDNSRLYLMWLNTNKVGTDKDIDKIKKDIQKVKSLVKKYGTQEIFVYGRDEAKGYKLIEQKGAWDSIRSEDVKVYVAGYKGTFEAIGKSLDLFVLAKAPIRKEANKFHSINHKIFSYANPQSGVENPYLYRRNYGVVLWGAGFDGAMIYAYQHSMGDAWNDSDHYLFRDHNFTYPTSNGVVKTIAWEGMREAIDDVRYLTLLENEIKKVRDGNMKDKYGIIEDAEKYLNAVKNKIARYNRPGKYTDNFYIDLYDFRDRVMFFITEIIK